MLIKTIVKQVLHSYQWRRSYMWMIFDVVEAKVYFDDEMIDILNKYVNGG